MAVPKYSEIPNLPFLIDDFYGMHFSGYLQSLIEGEVYFSGAYDREGLQLVERILQLMPESVCLDIGANVGVHSLFMAQLARTVHAFEPFPRNCQILRRNIDLNQIKNIELFCYGLADENAVREFFPDSSHNHGAGSFSPARKTRELVSLELRRGDDCLGHLRRIDFVKMDIEGFEYEAILGLRETLEKHRPVLLMEYLDVTQKKFGNRSDMLSMLPRGYRVAGTHMYKYSNFKGLLDTQHLRLEPFEFHKQYEQIVIYPETYESLFEELGADGRGQQ